MGTWFVAAVASYIAAHVGARFGSGGVRTAFVVAMGCAIASVGIVVGLAVKFFGRGIGAARIFIWSIASAIVAYFIWTIVTVLLARWVPPIWIGVYAVMSGAAVLVSRNLNAPVR
jgi:hypothetical protein